MDVDELIRRSMGWIRLSSHFLRAPEKVQESPKSGEGTLVHALTDFFPFPLRFPLLLSSFGSCGCLSVACHCGASSVAACAMAVVSSASRASFSDADLILSCFANKFILPLFYCYETNICPRFVPGTVGSDMGLPFSFRPLRG